LYDQMVRSLFWNQMCNRAGYNLYFAKRGSSDRTEALRLALTRARNDYVAHLHTQGDLQRDPAPVAIVAAPTRERPGLQVADYFLWALQRLYERGEDRFIQLLWPSVAFVWDQDDKRERKGGVWYRGKKRAGKGKNRTRQPRPLTAAALGKTPGI